MILENVMTKGLSAIALIGAMSAGVNASATSASWQTVEQDRNFVFSNCSCVSTEAGVCGSKLEVRSYYGPSSPGSSRSTTAFGDGDFLILWPTMTGSQFSIPAFKLSKAEWDKKQIPLKEASALKRSFPGIRGKNFGQFVATQEGKFGPWPDVRIRWSPEVRADLRLAGRFDIDLLAGKSVEASPSQIKQQFSSRFVTSLSSIRVGTVRTHEVSIDQGEVVAYRYEQHTMGIDQVPASEIRAQAAFRLIGVGLWGSLPMEEKSSSFVLECTK